MKVFSQTKTRCQRRECGLNLESHCQRKQGPCEWQGYPSDPIIRDATIMMISIIAGALLVGSTILIRMRDMNHKAPSVSIVNQDQE